MGLGSIIVGAMIYHNVVSKLDTDRTKPFMDTITADGIQPIVALNNVSSLFVIVGVFIVTLSLHLVILYVLGGQQIRIWVLFVVSIDQ